MRPEELVSIGPDSYLDLLFIRLPQPDLRFAMGYACGLSTPGSSTTSFALLETSASSPEELVSIGPDSYLELLFIRFPQPDLRLPRGYTCGLSTPGSSTTSFALLEKSDMLSEVFEESAFISKLTFLPFLSKSLPQPAFALVGGLSSSP